MIALLEIILLSVVSCTAVWRMLSADPNMAHKYAVARMVVPSYPEDEEDLVLAPDWNGLW